MTLQSLKFDPRHEDDRSINDEAFNKLYKGLKAVYPELGFCRRVLNFVCELCSFTTLYIVVTEKINL